MSVPGTPNRVIGTPDPEQALAGRAAVEHPGNPHAVIEPSHPRLTGLSAGDPYSESGTKIAFDELDDDMQNRVTGQTGQHAPAVQTIQDLRDVPPELRQDRQLRLVEDATAIYRFDTADTTTPDDGDLVVAPTDPGLVDGRWFKTDITIPEFAVHVADPDAHHPRFETRAITAVTGLTTTASLVDVLVSGMSRTEGVHFVGAGTYRIRFKGSGFPVVIIETMLMSIYVNGVQVSVEADITSSGNQTLGLSVGFTVEAEAVIAAGHVVEGRWRTVGGGVVSMTGRELVLERVA